MISYTLPVDTVPAIGGLLYPITFVVLQVAVNVYFHRAVLYRLLGARLLGTPDVSPAPPAGQLPPGLSAKGAQTL